LCDSRIDFGDKLLAARKAEIIENAMNILHAQPGVVPVVEWPIEIAPGKVACPLLFDARGVGMGLPAACSGAFGSIILTAFASCGFRLGALTSVKLFVIRRICCPKLIRGLLLSLADLTHRHRAQARRLHRNPAQADRPDWAPAVRMPRRLMGIAAPYQPVGDRSFIHPPGRNHDTWEQLAFC
jgi:hypothetical protein